MRPLLGSLALCLLALPAHAQPNRPPLARVSADRTEVAPGEVVQLMGSASLDPDMGPSPLTYTWDFGDMTTSTEADPTHAFAAAGIYPVTLVVRDGATQSLASLDIHVLDPPTATPPSASGPLWLDAERGRLWAVNPDSGTVTVVDTATDAVLEEISVGADPVSLAGDGVQVLVALRGEGTVVRLDAETREVRGELAVGHQPGGIAWVPGGGWIVTVEADDQAVRLAVDGASVVARIDVAPGPRAIAVTHDGARAFVAGFLTRGADATLSAIDLATDAVTEIRLAEDPGPDTATSGRGVPNLLRALAIDPSGGRLWVGGLKSNTSRGSYLSGEPFVFTNRLRALLAPVDLGDLADRVDRRIDVNDADSVGAISFSPSGRWAFVTNPGAGGLSVYDLSAARFFVRGVNGDTVPFAARVDLGDWPTGLAISGDGARLYALAELSRELVVLDVATPSAPVEVARVALTEEPLPPRVAEGKRLFHRSREPIHSQDNYIACASCHPEGGHDGRTWDFTQFGEGLRNTIDLRGRAGTGHGPLHWSANFNEVQDFENDIVGGFMGTGLAMDGMPPHPPLGDAPNGGRSDALDALSVYVTSLADGAPSPFRDASGYLTEAARRGRAIFEDPAVGCTECHAAPRFTDSTLTPDPADFVLHDVGTILESSGQRLGGPLPGIDTPSLIGAWHGAPYLHDGRAPTLRSVLVDHNPDDRHGVTSGLTDAQLDDLVAYLSQIDGRPEEPPPPAPDAGPAPDGGLTDGGPSAPPEAGCSCRAAPSGGGGMGWIFVLALAAWWRRKGMTR